MGFCWRGVLGLDEWGLGLAGGCATGLGGIFGVGVDPDRVRLFGALAEGLFWEVVD